MIATVDRPRDGTARVARLLAGPAAPVGCAALTLAVALVGIGGPSLWLDEAATISMTTRSYGDMLRVFPHLDLVHALYYMIMKPWVAAFGTGALALRLPGALAMAAAAAGVAVIGRRCLGPAAGLAAGLAWAAGPQTSRWAQEARSYAMTAAVAVLATYLLVRALDRDERRRWPWFAGYAPAVAVLGFLHLDGALLLAAHGATVLLTRPKAGVWLRWLASAAVAAAPLVVLALAAQDQKRQVKWLPRPSWDVAWTQLQFLTGDRALVAPVVTLALLGVVASMLGRASRPHPTASLPAVALPWALVPTVLLLLVSNVTDPVFYYRYTTYCLPAVALLVGAGVAGLLTVARHPAARAILVCAAVAALAVPSLPAHDHIRRQDSRPDDMRAAADVVRAHARPGDAIVYLAGSARWSAATYPGTFGRLRDAGMSTDPVTAANLKGRDLLPRELPPRLARADRVWVMDHRSLDPHGPVIERRERAVQSAGPWRKAGTWTYRGGWLALFERTGPYRSSR
ncbi:glycosyltransferase family 39 protein [Actinomadura luteofluorescens]|uniref:glycosyltransferase family 39 protein n=1 Tax=Actinomadura luteofluorescens TaxID=46163 RepID=UPI00349A25FA